MKNNTLTREQVSLINEMNRLIEFCDKNPDSIAMQLLKEMYMNDRITIDEFMTLINNK